MPNESFSKDRYKECEKIIKASAVSYSSKFRSNYVDYYDFYSEGILTFTLCIRNWSRKGKNPNDPEFIHYFRKSLVNNSKELLGKVFAQKRRGYYKPKDKTCFGEYYSGEPKELCETCENQEACIKFFYRSDVPLSCALELNGEGGFEEIHFLELVEYVKEKLTSSVERFIFTLLTDPPKELSDMALLENRKRMKVKLIKRKPNKSGDFPKGPEVRPTGQLIMKYMCKNGCPITANEYYAYWRKLKARIRDILKEVK